MSVEAIQATVWKGGNRRWFSLKAACNAEAAKLHRDRFKADCYCCDDSYSDHFGHEPGETCHLHGVEFYPRWRRRVARLLLQKTQEVQN